MILHSMSTSNLSLETTESVYHCSALGRNHQLGTSNLPELGFKPVTNNFESNFPTIELFIGYLVTKDL